MIHGTADGVACMVILKGLIKRMDNKERSSVSGVGFIDVVQIIFIVLKLCKVIDWSWWWVLSPLWASVAIFLILASIVAIAKARAKADEKES